MDPVIPDPSPIASPVVFTIRKKCYLCGTEWDGKAFTPQPEGATPLPGMCAACGEKEEAQLKALTARGPAESGEPLPELSRPRRATDGLDDEVDDDRHLRIAP